MNERPNLLPILKLQFKVLSETKKSIFENFPEKSKSVDIHENIPKKTFDQIYNSFSVVLK